MLNKPVLSATNATSNASANATIADPATREIIDVKRVTAEDVKAEVDIAVKKKMNKRKLKEIAEKKGDDKEEDKKEEDKEDEKASLIDKSIHHLEKLNNTMNASKNATSLASANLTSNASRNVTANISKN